MSGCLSWWKRTTMHPTTLWASVVQKWSRQSQDGLFFWHCLQWTTCCRAWQDGLCITKAMQHACSAGSVLLETINELNKISKLFLPLQASNKVKYILWYCELQSPFWVMWKWPKYPPEFRIPLQKWKWVNNFQMFDPPRTGRDSARVRLRRASHLVPYTSRGVVSSIELLTSFHQGWTLNVVREHLETYSGSDDITNQLLPQVVCVWMCHECVISRMRTHSKCWLTFHFLAECIYKGALERSGI